MTRRCRCGFPYWDENTKNPLSSSHEISKGAGETRKRLVLPKEHFLGTRLRLHRCGGLHLTGHAFVSVPGRHWYRRSSFRPGFGSGRQEARRRASPGVGGEGARSTVQQKKTLEGGTEDGIRSSAHTLGTTCFCFGYPYLP